jgi:protein TonB
MTQQRSFARFVPLLIGTVIVLIVVVVLILAIRSMMQEKKDSPKRQVAQIVKLVRPPPPPPEPPPPPPPEEKIEEPLQQEKPDEPPPDQSSPAEQLGIDAEGVAGGDGFGLAARKGGSDLVGGGRALFAWYTGRLKDAILNQLSDDERIRRGKYQVTVRVWVGTDGKVERVKLQSTSGNSELDAAIESVLQKLERMEQPPLEMPQPVTLRIVSK